MARELTAYGFAATLLAIPAGSASAMLIFPNSKEISMTLKYFSGGSLEIFNAPLGNTTGSANGVSAGLGYLLATSEVVNATGAPRYYLCATGATAVAYLLIGLSQDG